MGDHLLLLNACVHGVRDVVDSLKALPLPPLPEATLSGLSYAVTGGNSGFGFETAKLCARQGLQDNDTLP